MVPAEGDETVAMLVVVEEGRGTSAVGSCLLMFPIPVPPLPPPPVPFSPPSPPPPVLVVKVGRDEALVTGTLLLLSSGKGAKADTERG